MGTDEGLESCRCLWVFERFSTPTTTVSLRSLQVAEALLHMQVRLGMLKADDVPSLQAPPAPAVVGGAIMLGTGAPLPQLVNYRVYEALKLVCTLHYNGA